MWRSIIVTVAVLLTACTQTQPGTTAPKLYVFNCGTITFGDITAFGLKNDDTPVRELFVPCYLVDHPSGTLLWDAGLDPALAGQGKTEPEPGMIMYYETPLLEQLAQAGFSADDVTHMALSHMHFDHVGASGQFPGATLLIQETEYEAAFQNYEGNPIYVHETYAALANNQKVILNGDHDVFGDGTVTIVSAPGHTAGHQVLLLQLRETGPLVLSGDLYHFEKSRELRAVPTFNVDKAQTLQSMNKVEALIAAERATLWIEHNMSLANSLRLAPAFYE